MKKQKAKAAASKAQEKAPNKSAAPTTPAKPELLVVLKKDAKFRGARDKWYARLVEHDGKPVEAFNESAKADPPSLPKSGKAENPTGWLSYFKRQGVLEIKPA